MVGPAEDLQPRTTLPPLATASLKRNDAERDCRLTANCNCDLQLHAAHGQSAQMCTVSVACRRTHYRYQLTIGFVLTSRNFGGTHMDKAATTPSFLTSPRCLHISAATCRWPMPMYRYRYILLFIFAYSCLSWTSHRVYPYRRP